MALQTQECSSIDKSQTQAQRLWKLFSLRGLVLEVALELSQQEGERGLWD